MTGGGKRVRGGPQLLSRCGRPLPRRGASRSPVPAGGASRCGTSATLTLRAAVTRGHLPSERRDRLLARVEALAERSPPCSSDAPLNCTRRVVGHNASGRQSPSGLALAAPDGTCRLGCVSTLRRNQFTLRATLRPVCRRLHQRTRRSAFLESMRQGRGSGVNAGRGPRCAAALLAGTRGDPPALAFALRGATPYRTSVVGEPLEFGDIHRIVARCARVSPCDPQGQSTIRSWPSPRNVSGTRCSRIPQAAYLRGFT